MDSVLDIVQKEEQEVSQGQETKCEFCEESSATTFCLECPQYFCDDCGRKVHKLESLKDHHVLSVENYESEKGKGSPTYKRPDYCKTHQKQELRFYCDKCKIPICVECTVIDHPSPKHSCRCLMEVSAECCKKLTKMIAILRDKAQEVSNKCGLVETYLQKLKDQYTEAGAKVTTREKACRTQLEQEKQKVVEKLRTGYRARSECLKGDFDNLQLTYGKLVNTCCFIETLVSQRTPAVIVSTEHSMTRHLEELVALEIQPNLENDTVDFLPYEKVSERGMMGVVRGDALAKRCTVDGIPRRLLRGESVDLLITTADRFGRPVVPRRPVTVKLRRPDGAKRTLDVVDNGDCTHTVTVCGKHAGVYQVIVLVDYQEIPGSPFDILVIKGLVKLLGMKGNDVGEFNGPAGLTLTNDGDVAVVDPKNTRIQILDVDGNWKKMFEYNDIQDEFQPMDIAVSKDGRYFVTDAKNTQVVVSDENGQWLSCFGETELKYPRGIAISPLDGAVFVTDWDGKVLGDTSKEEHCIRKYTQLGKYVESFGKYGEEHGEFKGPSRMAIDKQGILFVADFENHRIQVFNADDQFLYKFGIKGQEDGQLWYPFDVCLDSDRYLYVSDYCPRVQKFDSGGRFKSRVDRKEDGLLIPESIAITADVPKRLLVSDTGNDCVFVFVL
ncbi:E3 ubiquitin-protein ligase TRIM71-like [Ptychodera flava]|uniref:E3 ubiquitin-protein ligase TRIM71-like n=1 Tax=Ptychodera flava TaxID=63121 RepID=UPI00396A3D06